MSEKQVKKVEKETAKKRSGLVGVVCCSSGNHIAPVYKRVYSDKLKRKVVTKVDEFDLFEFIQASKSQTDMALLEKRFIALGEVPSADGTYGSNDLSVFPDNIHDIYNMVNNIDQSFNSLPESVQKIFGNKDSYLASLLDGSYNTKLMQAIQNPQSVTPEKKAESVTEGE